MFIFHHMELGNTHTVKILHAAETFPETQEVFRYTVLIALRVLQEYGNVSTNYTVK